MLVRTWKSQNPHTSLVSVNSIAAVENSGVVPQKVKHIITRWPAILVQGIHLRESIYPCKKLYMNETSVLFIVAKMWKQPRCSSISEWIKMWYIHTMKYYSVLRRTEVLMLQHGWISKMLYWRIEARHKIPYMITFIWNIQNKKIHWYRKYISSC